VREYLLTLLVAATITYLTVGIVRATAVRFGILADIRDRDVHDVPIPRLGGVAMLLGLFAGFAVAAQLPLLRRVFESSEEIRGVLLGAVVICLVGVVDDVWGLDAVTKLAGQVLAAGLMALQGVQLFWIPLPNRMLSLDATSGTLVTVLVVVVTVNAVNFVDGLDGLAAGLIAISSGAFFLFSYILAVQHNTDHAATPLLISAVLVGMCLGFLVHNFNPARIFMGDSGSMLIGLLLASSTITLTGHVDFGSLRGLNVYLPTLVPLLLPFAILAIPVADLLLAVARRTRARRSPFTPDKQHLHHRLLEIGHSQRRAVLIMYGWTALIAYGAVGMAVLPMPVALTFMVAGVAFLVLVVAWPRLRPRQPGRPPGQPPSPGSPEQPGSSGQPKVAA
jgi:UDP-GlcNAc:undecaprenyl-phosphate/decaprenyl-phosphate GlcNAc-1-phosphate transferase